VTLLVDPAVSAYRTVTAALSATLRLIGATLAAVGLCPSCAPPIPTIVLTLPVAQPMAMTLPVAQPIMMTASPAQPIIIRGIQ
ncbi:MAG: hypothetical protein WA005_16105, partial [Candidatus Binataceae bacterium]